MRQRAQVGIVRVEHVQEAHAQARLVRAEQWALAGHAHDVQVVAQEHQVAGSERLVQAAGGVGDDQDLGTEAAHDAHGKRHVAQAVALVDSGRGRAWRPPACPAGGR